jgi:TRAP-type C4-dicarboxylate transport system permease small subunit
MRSKGIFDRIIDFMAFLAGVLIVGAVLIVCLEVCMRYFFRTPLIWTVEVCEYILFTLTFLGAPWLLKKGGHVNVDIVVEHLSKKAREYLNLVSCGVGIFICGVITWFSMTAAWDSYVSGVVVTKTLTIQKYYFLLLITLGYLFLLVEFARQFRNHLRASKEED